jgi:predicted dehydrogenase
MHRAYSEGAAEAGVHILCEKPMAVTEQECNSMIDAASRNNVKLMIAYRLHFEMGNLSAIGRCVTDKSENLGFSVRRSVNR